MYFFALLSIAVLITLGIKSNLFVNAKELFLKFFCQKYRLFLEYVKIPPRASIEAIDINVPIFIKIKSVFFLVGQDTCCKNHYFGLRVPQNTYFL